MLGAKLIKHDFHDHYNLEDNREGLYIVSYGPVEEGVAMEGDYNKWTGTLEGTVAKVFSPEGSRPGMEDEEGEDVPYPPQTVKTFDVPEGTYRFDFTFDLNGNMNTVYAVDDTITLTYSDESTGQDVVEIFNGYHPCLKLDGLDPESPYDIDVVLAYTDALTNPRLITRFQRERFLEEVDNGVVYGVNPHLRTMGLTPDNRFIYRFKAPVKQIP